MSRKKSDIEKEELGAVDVNAVECQLENLKQDIERLKELKKKQKKLSKLEREKDEILKDIIKEQKNEKKKH